MAVRKDRKTATKTIEISGVVCGRDKKIIDPNEVFKLAEIGCKDIEIANWFGLNPNTLRTNFCVELLKGRESLKQSLRKAQINAALSGNVVMLIWLGKNILGQQDQSTLTINENREQELEAVDDSQVIEILTTLQDEDEAEEVISQ